jgi:hypothetical protein
MDSTSSNSRKKKRQQEDEENLQKEKRREKQARTRLPTSPVAPAPPTSREATEPLPPTPPPKARPRVDFKEAQRRVSTPKFKGSQKDDVFSLENHLPKWRAATEMQLEKWDFTEDDTSEWIMSRLDPEGEAYHLFVNLETPVQLGNKTKVFREMDSREMWTALESHFNGADIANQRLSCWMQLQRGDGEHLADFMNRAFNTKKALNLEVNLQEEDFLALLWAVSDITKLRNTAAHRLISTWKSQAAAAGSRPTSKPHQTIWTTVLNLAKLHKSEAHSDPYSTTLTAEVLSVGHTSVAALNLPAQPPG